MDNTNQNIDDGNCIKFLPSYWYSDCDTHNNNFLPWSYKCRQHLELVKCRDLKEHEYKRPTILKHLYDNNEQ